MSMHLGFMLLPHDILVIIMQHVNIDRLGRDKVRMLNKDLSLSYGVKKTWSDFCLQYYNKTPATNVHMWCRGGKKPQFQWNIREMLYFDKDILKSLFPDYKSVYRYNMSLGLVMETINNYFSLLTTKSQLHTFQCL